MTSISDLPPEILENILQNLAPHMSCSQDIRDKDTKDLSRISLVNSLWHACVERVLYRWIEVTTKRSRPLLVRLLKAPHLAKNVRELYFTIRLNYGYTNPPLTDEEKELFQDVPFVKDFLKETHTNVDHLFGRKSSHPVEAGIFLTILPNLSHIHFAENCRECKNFCEYGGSYEAFEAIISSIFFRAVLQPLLCMRHHDNSAIPMGLKSLESFSWKSQIKQAAWDIDLLAPLFFCPKISSIAFSGPRSMKKKDQNLFSQIQQATGNKPCSPGLEELSFENANIDPETLREILTLPRALQKFTYIRANPREEEGLVHNTEFEYQPELFQLALESQKHQLEELTFLKLECFGSDHNKELISLKSMVALKCLRIEVGLLFDLSIAGPQQALYDRLPESLRELTLVFHERWRMGEIFFQDVISQLNAIAGNCKALRHVTLEPPRFMAADARNQWDEMVQELAELFENAGIGFYAAEF